MGAPEFPLCVVIDDDADILAAAALALRGLFGEVVTAQTPEIALPALTRGPDVVLLDANYARGATDSREGIGWLERLLATDPSLAVVMITAHAGVQIAVEAMRRGAVDFVAKPWSNDRLVAAARTAAALRRGRAVMAAPAGGATALSPLIGASPAMLRVESLIARAAPTDANVLILGENGTGKELVARALHQRSGRASRPFVTVDLGAISAELIDSELFGHKKGAFTDARADRVGRIESANGGTLFLDEIGNLPLYLQPKLLTALEQRRVVPVGGNAPISVDIRLVAATNMTRADLNDSRQFRQDLLFRLNTVEIELPPLRERREDIPTLVDHYLRVHAERYRRHPPALAEGTMAALVAYRWPGNVRALRHAAERAVILAGEAPLTPLDFGLDRGGDPGPAPVLSGVVSGADFNLERVERRLVEEALKRHGYNISASAEALGISRAALYRRMEKHGL